MFHAGGSVQYPRPGRETCRFDSIEALAAFYACPAHPDAAPCAGESCPFFKAQEGRAAFTTTRAPLACRCAAPRTLIELQRFTMQPLAISREEAAACALPWDAAAPMGYVAPQGRQYGPQATKGGADA